MLDNDSVNLSRVRLANAGECLIAAADNLSAGHYKTANNRAYYAAFYAIRALLALDGVDFKTHSKTIGYFNRNYIKTNLMDRSLSESILSASKSRNSSDYEDYYIATKEEAEKNIAGARKMLEAAEQYIKTRLEAEPIQEVFGEYESSEYAETDCDDEDEDELEQ